MQDLGRDKLHGNKIGIPGLNHLPKQLHRAVGGAGTRAQTPHLDMCGEHATEVTSEVENAEHRLRVGDQGCYGCVRAG
jgi:hypothetical protein